MKLVNPGRIEVQSVDLDSEYHTFCAGQEGRKFDHSYFAPRAILNVEFHGSKRRIIVTLDRGVQAQRELSLARAEAA